MTELTHYVKQDSTLRTTTATTGTEITQYTVPVIDGVTIGTTTATGSAPNLVTPS